MANQQATHFLTTEFEPSQEFQSIAKAVADARRDLRLAGRRPTGMHLPAAMYEVLKPTLKQMAIEPEEYATRIFGLEILSRDAAELTMESEDLKAGREARKKERDATE